MRAAAIDVGSNTVRLLIADVRGRGRWRVVAQDQMVTRLGEGLAAAGALGEAPMARTLAVVLDYAGRARELGASAVRIVATSAVREAGNGRAFAAAVERVAGVPVEILSGEEEARLALRGVRRGLPDLGGALVTFDIGGGSTEYVLAHEDAVRAAVSLRLGVVPLAERFPFRDAVDWGRYQALRDEVSGRLARELPAGIRESRPAHLVGTAGTVTTLAALDLGLARYDPSRVHGHVLGRRAVAAQLARLGALPVAGRAALPCLEPGRADLIVPGIAIVQATLDCLGVDALVVSEYGLREGLLVDALEGPRHPPHAAP
ncbi:MAG: Ppx/GppA family phosphatase [Candidatus Rokubacteria bacterium]|nr:Ppx/GppA family phosphatase [Candidatus Rokubacteria bacterium]